MKMDWEARSVVEMEADEVTLFVLYREQVAEQNGLTRDRLPYTPQMDHLLSRFNRQTKAEYSHLDLWEKLKTVLKCGEERIEAYLSQKRIQFPHR